MLEMVLEQKTFTPSPNRAYLASLRVAQIQLHGWTSDTLEALYEISVWERKMTNSDKRKR